MKPMLASKLEGDLAWPKLASPKIDGIRCIVQADGHLAIGLSRSLKPIPNEYVQAFVAHKHLIGLDGELAVGPVTAKNLMQATMSGVMSADGEPDFTLWVFDDFSHPHAFAHRLASAKARVLNSPGHRLEVVPHVMVESLDQLLAYEQEQLALGYEGVMLRNPEGLYKHGRATWKTQDLVKVKRFTDSEAEVVGFEELMHNHNEAKTNELGRTQRSSHQANKVGGNVLGVLIGRDIHDGRTVRAGTGFTADQRMAYWMTRDSLLGSVFKYKHFDHGVVDEPRHPVFLGWRDTRDLS